MGEVQGISDIKYYFLTGIEKKLKDDDWETAKKEMEKASTLHVWKKIEEITSSLNQILSVDTNDNKFENTCKSLFPIWPYGLSAFADISSC